jgi:succinate dehydrogenase hydrophobic anchor subunit
MQKLLSKVSKISSTHFVVHLLVYSMFFFAAFFHVLPLFEQYIYNAYSFYTSGVFPVISTNTDLSILFLFFGVILLTLQHIRIGVDNILLDYAHHLRTRVFIKVLIDLFLLFLVLS